jgi:rhodanese-related sulfurtransferase
MKLRVIVVSLLSLSIFSCTGQQTASETSFKDVSVEQASKMLQEKKNILVLDVRTPGEVAEGTIEGATVIDYQGATFNSIIDQLDKEQPVLVYCAVGGRSGKTMEIMKEKGFKEVYNLSGGFTAWKAAGKSVVK